MDELVKDFVLVYGSLLLKIDTLLLNAVTWLKNLGAQLDLSVTHPYTVILIGSEDSFLYRSLYFWLNLIPWRIVSGDESVRHHVLRDRLAVMVGGVMASIELH